MPDSSTTAGITPYLEAVSSRTDLVDWGVQSDAIEGVSHSSGRLLFKGPNNSPETGLWVCTPGRWRLSIPGTSCAISSPGTPFTVTTMAR